MYDSPISFTESSAIIMDHTQSKALEVEKEKKLNIKILKRYF